MEHSAVQNTHRASEHGKFLALIGFILIVATVVAGYEAATREWMRAFMGTFFIIFALFQLAGYASFTHMFRQYDPIAKHVAIYATLYPFIGLLLGFLYLFDVAAGTRDVITAFIMLIGAWGVWGSIKSTRNTVHCACLGDIIKLPLSNITLTEDLVMGVMALLMLFL